MLCIECEENEAVGGFYCEECTNRVARNIVPEIDMTARFGRLRYCRRCRTAFRDKVEWQAFCVAHRKKG